ACDTGLAQPAQVVVQSIFIAHAFSPLRDDSFVPLLLILVLGGPVPAQSMSVALVTDRHPKAFITKLGLRGEVVMRRTGLGNPFCEGGLQRAAVNTWLALQCSRAATD